MSVACMVCDSDSRFLASCGNYRLYACLNRDCGHVHVHPLPSDVELQAVYSTTESSLANSDGWTLAEDYRRSPEVIHDYYHRTRLDWLSRHVPALADRSCAVLDVGCSTGTFLRVLSDKGYRHVAGMDISPESVAYVQSEQKLPCYSRLADVPDRSFDLITCCAVLEHTPDPLVFLADVTRKLRPGGRLHLCVPNYDSFYRRMAGSAWLWLIPPVHLQYFGPHSLGQACRASGLSPEKIESYYSGTYLYLFTHHVTRLLGRPMPSTTRTQRSGAMNLMIRLAETGLSSTLAPVRALARRMDKGNELRAIVAAA